MLSRFWLSLFFLLIIAAAGYGAYQLYSFNHFDKIEDRFAGSCSPVTGIAGPEDIQIDTATRRAFVSSLDRRALRSGEAVRGAVFSVNVDDPLDRSGWRDRTGGIPAEFEPHGLHFYEGEGVRRLFVVNGANSAVELFDVTPEGDLTHLETFTERRLTSPNDVVAVGPRSFYVSNDVEPGRNSMLGKLHFLGRAASGSVYYFNGVAWRLAAEGLRYANGVNVSPDGSRFYVAETSGGVVSIYQRDTETGALKDAGGIMLDAAPDNINVDETGILWIAAMPKPLTLPAHNRSEENRAPSQIWSYADSPGATTEPAAVYTNAGEAISAATSAAHLDGKLLIGALLDERYLLCDLGA